MAEKARRAERLPGMWWLLLGLGGLGMAVIIATRPY